MRLIWDADGKKYATNEPTAELIEELIDELDNETHTMVALDARGLCSMIACGGEDGRVRVNYVPEDLEKSTKHLLDHQASNPEDVIHLMLQGKKSAYKRIHTVPKYLALQALVEFARTTTPAPTMDWIDDA
ncbi:MAG: hypothetical protein RLP44_05835 [Aggregatilineales bacterium]